MGAHISDPRSGTREVLDALRRIVQALRESSRQAELEVGLTGAQLFVLDALAAEPALSLNDLADRTHTHQSSVSTVVARLVKRGLIRRGRAPEDSRRLVLTVSPEGRRLIGRAPDVAQNRLVRSIDRLPDPARRALCAVLVSLAQELDGTNTRPPMFFDLPTRKGHRKP